MPRRVDNRGCTVFFLLLSKTKEKKNPYKSRPVIFCRYLLDHPEVTQGQQVLDIGAGCGASAIGAARCGAERVCANDISTGNIQVYFDLRKKSLENIWKT